MHAILKISLVFGILFMCTSCSDDGDEWKKLNSKDGNFVINMPPNPKTFDKTEMTPFGKQVTHYITWKPSSFAMDKFKLFQVTYTNCPANVMADSALLHVMLDSGIVMVQRDYTEEEMQSEDIELNGYHAKAFFYDAKGGSTLVTNKMCIAGNKLYNLTVISKKNYSTTHEINDFFNSFQVLR